MKQPFWAATSLLLLVCATITGCDHSKEQATQSNNKATKDLGSVQIGFSAWPGWFPWQVAQEKELFKPYGITANTKWFTNYNDSITALEKGTIDGNSQTLADTISSVAKGNDLVVVLTNDNSTGNDMIVINSNIKSIKDLKGKKVAAEKGTVDHFLLVEALKKAGMSIKDIQFIPMETSKAADAFAAGKVDAAAVFAPFTTTALKRTGSRELFSSKDFPGSISDHLVFSRKFINEHPDRVQAVVDSWFDTIYYIRNGANTNESDEIMSKRAGVSMAEYKDYLDGTRIFSVEDNIETFKLGSDSTYLSKAAIETNKFLLENKLIKNSVNTSRLFDDRFVKAYADKNKRL